MTTTTPAGYSPSTKAPAKQPMRYEHRLNPDDPWEVQVRPRRKRMGNHDRGATWKRYMLCSSPAAALRILSMLAEAESEREVQVVTP